jgi:hypothetical protein
VNKIKKNKEEEIEYEDEKEDIEKVRGFLIDNLIHMFTLYLTLKSISELKEIKFNFDYALNNLS